MDSTNTSGVFGTRTFKKRDGERLALSYPVGFKVRMSSGRLTREKWVKNQVREGQVVKDSDGRLFRIKLVTRVPEPIMPLTTLKIVHFPH